MKLLLDTHVLLRWLNNDRPLSQEAFQVIHDGANFVFISAATAWEISSKKALGKLQAPDDLENALLVNRFQSLPITIPHALLAGQLPPHHDAPFDRLLSAQSMIEGLTLVTCDTKQMLYDVQIIKA